MKQTKKTTSRDLTKGNIAVQVLLFSLPLMLGNVFQMLYNTVDSIVVGNFVGTQALAAVGSTTMIVNLFVFFFNGFSIGAGVVIGNLFGAGNLKKLHDAVETVMAASFILCVIFTAVSVAGVESMLRFMATPEDVFASASTYLKIYCAGISGLLIYNIGSGILRAFFRVGHGREQPPGQGGGQVRTRVFRLGMRRGGGHLGRCGAGDHRFAVRLGYSDPAVADEDQRHLPLCPG